VKLLERGNLRLYKTHRDADVAPLLENIDAESTDALVEIREISFLLALEAGFEVLGHYDIDDFLYIFLGRRIDFDGEQIARDAESGMTVGFNMDVRRAHVGGKA
jgi:hypothetical protein